MQAAKRPSKRERGKGAKRKRLKEGRRLQQNKAKAKERKMKPLLLVTKTALLVSVFFFFLVFHFVVVVACPPTFRFSFVVFFAQKPRPHFSNGHLADVFPANQHRLRIFAGIIAQDTPCTHTPISSP